MMMVMSFTSRMMFVVIDVVRIELLSRIRRGGHRVRAAS